MRKKPLSRNWDRIRHRYWPIYWLIYLEGHIFLRCSIAGAHLGPQGIDAGPGVGRQGEIDLLSPGAVEPAAIHTLGLPQDLPLKKNLPADGHREGLLLRSEDGIDGGQL